ncbi:hypothetical protein EV201_2856 [Ancylomarina subtilis]|uniref:Uncharacterized protein n=1 Tax=Ancylomarina subtilis TaxID=1639035 RepID=A0A4Q7VA04_9BACT|nr:hypothetical protein EV201_2856 [Ancylomarina subtilis]
MQKIDIVILILHVQSTREKLTLTFGIYILGLSGELVPSTLYF